MPNLTSAPQSCNATSIPPIQLSELLTLTLQRAAAVTGISIATLCRHAKLGRLDLIKVGSRTLVEARSLEALLSGRTHS
jgi:hypothetical protein